MRKYKKILSVVLIILLLSVKVFIPLSVLAEDISPTPTGDQVQDVAPTPMDSASSPQADTQIQVEVTPAPTETQTDPTPTPMDSASSPQADTQNLEQVAIDSAPVPTPTETTTDIETRGTLNNDVVSGSNSGDNSASQSADLSPASNAADITPTPIESGQAESSSKFSENGAGTSTSSINTGDAVSVTKEENQVNTNVINSKIIHHTINLFVDENGDINLSDPFQIAQHLVVNEQSLDETVNIMAKDVGNYAVLSNDVVAISNTGANTIEGSMTAEINTGNAISVVSLLNQVNFTIDGSTLHIVTINIFGKLTGNIILPEFSSLESCSNCGMSVQSQNQAVVNNNVVSEANSGENGTVYSDTGTIESGDAASVVNLTNFLNTNILGMLLFNLAINVYGDWNGQFLGWGNVLNPADGGNGLVFNFTSPNTGQECPSCMSDMSIYSSADVTNNIASSVNTGRNLTTGRNTSIKTGNAVSVVQLSNFVNTNFINSIGFFGFINIFGQWRGDIGGASTFITPTPTPEREALSEDTSEDSSDTSRENGGQLSIFSSNNVGEYVLPGDTVTFFVNVLNSGSGKVYGAKLRIALFLNGKDVGGPIFELGDIGVGRTVRLNTGLVLSNKAPGGMYVAHAVVTGTTGEDTVLSAESSSSFYIKGVLGAVLAGASDQNENNAVSSMVAAVKNAKSTQNNYWIILLLSFTFSFLVVRAFKRWDKIKIIFAKSVPFYLRLRILRSFLL